MRIATCKKCGTQFECATGRRGIYCGVECSRAMTNKLHGLSDTIEHRAWARIRRRCNSPSYHNYPRYGGRGIKVCERWDDFNNFLADMGQRPEGMTLDRIDNDGHYEPSNCRWATMKVQANNRGDYNYSAEEDRKLREAIDRGYNFRQIAEYVGLSEKSVTGRAYRLGLHSGTPAKPKCQPDPSQQHSAQGE